MAQSIVHLPSLDLLQRSAAVLAANAAGDTPRIHALNKAAYQFATNGVELVETFGGFLITSATRAGVIHRLDTVGGCSCEAGSKGRVCWHRAALEIVEDAQRYTRPTMPDLTVAPPADWPRDAATGKPMDWYAAKEAVERGQIAPLGDRIAARRRAMELSVDLYGE